MHFSRGAAHLQRKKRMALGEAERLLRSHRRAKFTGCSTVRAHRGRLRAGGRSLLTKYETSRGLDREKATECNKTNSVRTAFFFFFYVVYLTHRIAVRSLLERRRVANESVGTFDAVACAVDGREANAQVFQVRDGVLSDRQSFYLSNETERERAPRWPRSSCCSTTAGTCRSRRCWSSSAEVGEQRGAGRRAGAAAARGRSSCARPSAARSAASSSSPSATRGSRSTRSGCESERRRQSRVEALEGLQQALGLDAPPIRIECFDISNLGGTQTVASMVVFEGGAPKKSDYRRFKIRSLAEGESDDYAAMAEVLSRRFAQWERQADLSPHDPAYDASFASLPNVVVIDGGKGQLAAGLGPLRGFRERGVAVDLAGQADRGGVHPRTPRAARARPLHARAAAAAARPRRGAPLRHHPPPRPSRQGDDELAARRAARRRPGAQARAARPLRLARGGRRGLAARSCRPCPACPPRSAREMHAYLHRAG